MDRELEDAVEAYWAAAYNEGKYDLTTDDGRAQDALNRIRAGVGKLEARVAELEGAIRTLHALAESHFGEGTIDVPAMPELNRK